MDAVRAVRATQSQTTTRSREVLDDHNLINKGSPQLRGNWRVFILCKTHFISLTISAMELHHLERKKSSDLSVQSVRRPEHANPSNSKEPPEGKMTKSVVSLKSEASVPRQKVVRLARIQFLTLCWTLFHIGWNDGSTGPLIPRIREHYNVSKRNGSSQTYLYLILFHRLDLCWFPWYSYLPVWCVSSWCSSLLNSQRIPQGFLTGAVANIYLTDKLAFGKVLTSTSPFHAN